MSVSLKPNRKSPGMPSISDDPRSHTLALQQIKECIEVGERRIPAAVLNSYIKVSDLVDLEIVSVAGTELVFDADLDGGVP